MKKVKITILTLVLALIMIPSFVSCKGDNKDEIETYQSTINGNVKTSTKVETVLTIKDSDVVVYNQIKTITIVDETKATVVFTTTSLDDNFELVTSKDTEIIENLKVADLFSLTLQKDLFKSYTLKDNNFNGEIAKENISKVFNSDIKTKDIAKLSIAFENNKIKKIECTYVTETNRVVTLCTTYEY